MIVFAKARKIFWMITDTIWENLIKLFLLSVFDIFFMLEFYNYDNYKNDHAENYEPSNVYRYTFSVYIFIKVPSLRCSIL